MGQGLCNLTLKCKFIPDVIYIGLYLNFEHHPMANIFLGKKYGNGLVEEDIPRYLGCKSI
jgi:hypothetical protein